MATDDGYSDLQRALAVLARLASTTTTSKSNPYDVIGRSPDWSWEGLRHQACFVAHDIQDYLRAVEAGVVAPRPPPGWADTSTEWWPLLRTDRFSRPEQAKRLAGLDQLRHRDTILRAGWLWLTGTVDIDGEDQVVCMPLLQTRIKLEAGRFSGDRTWSVVDAGDVYANPLMQPESEVDWVLSNPQFGRGWGQREFVWSTKARSWVARAAQACGLTIESWGQPSTDPRSLRRKEGLVAIPGFGVYIDPANRVMPRSKQLMEWTTSRGISETAFAHLYGQRGPANNDPVDDSTPIRATRPMLPEQREVVRLARSEPIVTVTGPPGTGKTHVMCEIALDAVARNQSVLIGANSEFAVEVLAKQIDVAGGPIPVQFGGSIRGADLSDRLIELTSSTTPRLRQRAEEEMDQAATAYQTLVARFDDLLAFERRINIILADPTYRLKHEGRLAQLPGGANQLEALAADLARIRRSSPLTRWWRARSLERRTALSIDELGPEVEALTAYRQASRLLAGDGLTLTALADRMTDAGTDVFAANARWLGHLTVERLADNALGKRTIQQISTASRAGRSRRREMLSQVNGAALADAAPLWLGTVDDIDDVLPANAAMFDLLILDEASQMDQIAAAGALLRSSRAVVCGDPRQLRHVSFLSDAAIDSANSNLAAEPGVEAADVRIDVRRDSVFDFGLGVGQALRLDTHFRSEPHLIDFSARRFYDRRLTLATRSPLTDQTDRIEVHHVDGRRQAKVNQAEIDAVLHQIKILSGVEFRSIGVISPFRAQVDALTEAILAEWEPDAMARRKLEVGTVHAFQGAEFDAVVASWVLDQDSAPQTWSFLNDPNLFNVMITRARKKMIVFTSHPEPPGLAGQYVNHGLEPPRRDQGHPPPESPDRFSTITASAQSWINRVADALIDAGYTVEVGYQVGPFAVDVVVRNLAKPVAVICWPAVEGDEHHRQREQVLRRLGWQVLDAFESRWHDHVGHYAVEFSDKVGPMRPHVKESPS